MEKNNQKSAKPHFLSWGRINILWIILGLILVIFLTTPLISTITSVSFSDYWSLWSDFAVLNSLKITFWAAILAVCCGIVFGVPLAYVFARVKFPGRRLIQSLVNLPLIIPHTAAGVALIMVFGRYGIWGNLFRPIGVFFTDKLAGVVVAMLFVGVPFLVNASRQAFESIDTDLEQAARVDGADSWDVFFWITLPLTWKGILNGAVMMWARGVSEFGAVAIIAYHPKIVPVLVFERFQGLGLKAALPVTGLLIFVSIFIFLILNTILSVDQSS